MWCVSVELLTIPDYNDICTCTPKCIRDVFKTRLSQSLLSHAMVETFAMTNSVPSILPGALILGDYIIMDRTNRQWTYALLDISKLYENARNKVMSITHLTENVTAESSSQVMDAFEANCLLTAAKSICNSLGNFSNWENSSYYLDINIANVPSENFMSRMAHDIVRKLDKMDNFSAGFLGQVDLLIDSAARADVCNSTSGEYILNATVARLAEAKKIMVQIIEAYTALKTNIAQHSPPLQMQPLQVYTRERYHRWRDPIIQNLIIM